VQQSFLLRKSEEYSWSTSVDCSGNAEFTVKLIVSRLRQIDSNGRSHTKAYESMDFKNNMAYVAAIMWIMAFIPVAVLGAIGWTLMEFLTKTSCEESTSLSRKNADR